MAGSRKWMVYTSDNNREYAVQIDESNGEVADFGDVASLQDILGNIIETLPRGFQMRYANTSTSSNDGGNRKVWIGRPSSDIISGIVSTILLPFFGTPISAAVAYAVGSIVGERSGARPKTEDSGVLDGDNT